MATWSFKSSVRTALLFILPRYPFVSAVTLLMFMAERAKRERQPPFDPNLIYANVIMLFFCGVGMGFNFGRRFVAFAHALQLLCCAVYFYTNESLKYRYWVKVRVAHRMLGVAGYFFLFAFFSSYKPRPKIWKRLGEITVGLYVLISTYVLLQSPEDKEAFLNFVPGSKPALFIYATLLAAVGLCYLPGMFVYDVTQLLVPLLAFHIFVVDSQISYWTNRRGLDYWNQVRLVTDSVAILSGAIMYLTCTKKRMVDEEKLD